MSGNPPVDVFELGSEHEQVVFCNDRATGLKAIVAIHSTALGPALGGTRFYPYASTDDAIVDVLNLSRGMSYKTALAGLDLGGGKAVIIGDPATLKTEALLRAYGRFVQSLGGRYYTACDVGTFSVGHGPHRARVRLRHRSHHRARRRGRQLGRSRRTASSRACARRPSRSGASRRCTGAPSASPASARSGATWCGTWSRTARPWSSPTCTRPPSTRWAPSTRRWPRSARPTSCVASDIDVYAPCALGGAISDEVRRGADGEDRLRRRQQPARPPGHREAGRRARHPLRARTTA